MLLVFLSLRKLQGFWGLCARNWGQRPIYIYFVLFHSDSPHCSHIGAEANSAAIISPTQPIVLPRVKQLQNVVLPAIKSYSSEVTNVHNSCSQIFGHSHIASCKGSDSAILAYAWRGRRAGLSVNSTNDNHNQHSRN